MKLIDKMNEDASGILLPYMHLLMSAENGVDGFSDQITLTTYPKDNLKLPIKIQVQITDNNTRLDFCAVFIKEERKKDGDL